VASIRLYLETLQTRAVEEEKRNQFYEIMLEDSERLLATIEQVLRTGRIGASSSQKVNATRFDLDDVVKECLARARTLHRVPEDALSYRAGAHATVMGDLDEVRAAISNLIDNAVKYSGPKVQVTVETANVDGGFVSVRVRDRGLGIPKSELKRIFKRFYRVSSHATDQVKGTGLGLFIVRSIVRRHGGEVFAESSGEGLGSIFTIRLPRVYRV